MDFSAQELLFFSARPKAQDIYLAILEKILGLSGWPLESPRLFGRAQAKPGRFTCHIVLTEAVQQDPELLGWLEQAYIFACRA